jgi:hypothetical protein
MKGRDGRPGTDPENKRGAGAGATGPQRRQSYVARATARGRSGYGVESVRPYLDAQFKMQELMKGPLAPLDLDDKPDHHVDRDEKSRGW